MSGIRVILRRWAGALAGVLVLGLGLGLGGCSGAEETTAPPSPTTTTTTSTPTATPAPEPEPTSTPLQGGPVLAVRLDHVDAAYPRVGVGSADVVYVDEVEYGLTRLLAVFSSALPESVGPIRSARPNDPTILANWGPVPLVHSGASRQTYVYLEASSHIDVPHGSGPGFRRDGSRRAPHNLMGTPATLLQTAGGSRPPEDVGFRYGPPPAGGTAATTVSTRYPSTRMSATYDPDSGGYLVTTNGRPEIDALTGDAVQPNTIVVQKVVSRDSTNVTADGAATPLAELVGTGEVTVLRDGLAWEGTWSRASEGKPTEFRVGEEELLFSPGQVWLWLVPTEQAVTVE